MKELKFRAWDKINKKMYPVIGFDTKRYMKIIDLIKVAIEDEIWTSICIPINDVEIMQYTGLKDKNGVEIYEGYIVKCNFSFGDNICKIIEENGCYWVSQKNTEIKDYIHGNLYYYLDYIEVIGNIYENPELLKII